MCGQGRRLERAFRKSLRAPRLLRGRLRRLAVTPGVSQPFVPGQSGQLRSKLSGLFLQVTALSGQPDSPDTSRGAGTSRTRTDCPGHLLFRATH